MQFVLHLPPWVSSVRPCAIAENHWLICMWERKIWLLTCKSTVQIDLACVTVHWNKLLQSDCDWGARYDTHARGQKYFIINPVVGLWRCVLCICASINNNNDYNKSKYMNFLKYVSSLKRWERSLKFSQTSCLWFQSAWRVIFNIFYNMWLSAQTGIFPLPWGNINTLRGKTSLAWLSESFSEGWGGGVGPLGLNLALCVDFAQAAVSAASKQSRGGYEEFDTKEGRRGCHAPLRPLAKKRKEKRRRSYTSKHCLPLHPPQQVQGGETALHQHGSKLPASRLTLDPWIETRSDALMEEVNLLLVQITLILWHFC